MAGVAVDFNRIFADVHLLNPSAVREQPGQFLNHAELLPVAGSQVLEDRRAGLEATSLLVLPADPLGRNLQALKRAHAATEGLIQIEEATA